MRDYKKKFKRLLSYEMPDELRNKLNHYIEIDNGSEEEMKNLLEILRKRKVILKSRTQIDWYPRINQKKCNGCKICFDFCKKGVYTIKVDDIFVTNPYECVLMCSKCMSKCPMGAIDFPDKKDYKHLIVYK